MKGKEPYRQTEGIRVPCTSAHFILFIEFQSYSPLLWKSAEIAPKRNNSIGEKEKKNQPSPQIRSWEWTQRTRGTFPPNAPWDLKMVRSSACFCEAQSGQEYENSTGLELPVSSSQLSHSLVKWVRGGRLSCAFRTWEKWELCKDFSSPWAWWPVLSKFSLLLLVTLLLLLF